MYYYTRAITYDSRRDNDCALCLVQEPLGAEGKDEPKLLILHRSYKHRIAYYMLIYIVRTYYSTGSNTCLYD